MNIGWIVAKIKCKFTHSQTPILEYYRSVGIKIGNDCLICSRLSSREPFLIEIGNNVTISTNVTFCTHDNSGELIFPGKELYGKIHIGNNCFIGENTTLMYGIEIGDDVIIAAGSVVTKSFHDKGIIIGGNPAHIIGTWDKFREKYKNNVVSRKEMSTRVKNDESFLVKR